MDLIRRLHQHRGWVNGNLVAACQPLSSESLRQQFEIGQGSIWKTLLHLYAAEYAWLAALQGNDDPLVPGDLPGKIPGNQEGEDRIQALPELARKWYELERRWNSYLRELPPESLAEIVFKNSIVGGISKRYGTRRADVLLHVCTHAQYTTAQLVNMLRQLGVQPLPEVMLIALVRRERSEKIS